MPNSSHVEMEPSKIGITKLGSRIVLTPKGSITGQEIETLESMINEYIRDNKNEIIIDLKSISFMDSLALEFILRVHGDLKNRGGALKLINVKGICKDILIATRLITVLNIHEDIHQAIKNGT